MNSTKIGIAALSLTLLVQATPAHAQGRWAFEFRAHGALATQDEVRDESQGGLGFEGTFLFRLQEHLGVYAGWDWSHFGALESIAGPDVDMEETGYVAGLRFEHPVSAGSRTALWFRGGATVNHLELEDPAGDLIDDTGHGLGWEAGAGVAVRVGRKWDLTPGIRYRSLSRDVEVGALIVTVPLQYVAFEMGIRRSF
jgi:hypothetical protein